MPMPQQGPQRGDKGQLPDGSTVTFDGTGWLRDEASPADASGGVLNTLSGMLKDVSVGAVKGAGQTATNLGSLVHKVPGFSTAMEKVWGLPKGGSQEAFKQANEELTPTNTAQKVGKVGEQVAEFFIPGKATGKAATEGLARLIPDAASPATMSILNKAAAIGGRIAGDMTNAGAISALHGDKNVDREVGMAGAGTGMGEILAQLEPILISNPVLRHALPVFLAAAVGGKMGGLSGAGIGAGMGMFGVKRSLANDFLEWVAKNPQKVQAAIRAAGRLGGAGMAGVQSEYEKAGPVTTELRNRLGQ